MVGSLRLLNGSNSANQLIANASLARGRLQTGRGSLLIHHRPRVVSCSILSDAETPLTLVRDTSSTAEDALGQETVQSGQSWSRIVGHPTSLLTKLASAF